MLEERYRRTMINREISQTLARIEAAGVQVMYRSLDVRDAAAVAAAIGEAAHTLGPIRGIVHGAGVLAGSPHRREDRRAVRRGLLDQGGGLHRAAEAVTATT